MPVRDVLVFTPVLRLEPETVRAIFSLEWDGPISILLQRDNPVDLDSLDDWTAAKSDEMIDRMAANHLHQYQRGREAFLAGPYDAMLVIENDIIPPPDALKRLAALDCDVAYGTYMFRGNQIVNVLQRYYPWPETCRNTGESLSLHPELWFKAMREGSVECSGSGLGCILIRRKVVEEVPFEKPEGRGFFDWPWTIAVHAKGYKMRADMRILCGHKMPDGKVLMPHSPFEAL